MILESLESRQLLSVSHISADVSALAKPKPKPKPFKEAGTLTGTMTVLLTHPATAFAASGQVGTLGSVQLQSIIPAGPHPKFVITLTSAQGTMNFAGKPARHGFTLTLKQGTGAYTGWTGTGTLTITPTGFPTEPPKPVPVSDSLKLTLKA
jgi:hypothetical protein